jgi:hypothetical protein
MSKVVGLRVKLSEGYRQVRSRPRSAQGNFKHGLRNVDAHDRAHDAYSRSEGQRGLAAAATNVDYMLTLSRLQYVNGGKTQWLDLTIQWLLKLCPCFAGLEFQYSSCAVFEEAAVI